VIWYPAGFESYLAQTNAKASLAAKYAYEAFLLSHAPDIILVTSLFEGAVDPTVTSIHRYQSQVPVACVLFDLIPYTNPSPYLENPAIKAWYLEKIDDLKRADLLLSISAYSRQEAIDELGLDPAHVVNISSAVDHDFYPGVIPESQQAQVRQRYNLTGDFVMYTGGADHRKNIDGLIQAFAALPIEVRTQTQLAIVCSVPDILHQRLTKQAKQLGLCSEALVMTGYVPDEDLKCLYSLCKLFVFPSFQEGFGLPALEAMHCGAPVIGSNRSSIPEVIGFTEALFDPSDMAAMSALMNRGLTDALFRTRLQKYQQQHAEQFDWDQVARRALNAMEVLKQPPLESSSNTEPKVPSLAVPAPAMARPRLAFFSPMPPAKSGIADYSAMLLPSLSSYYEIDIIVDQDEPVTDPWVLQNLSIRTTNWFAQHFKLIGWPRCLAR